MNNLYSNNILPGNRRNEKAFNLNILWWFLGIVISIIIIYVVVMSTKYLITTCEHKVNYFKYLFGFKWNAVCHDDVEPEHPKEDDKQEEKHEEPVSEPGFLDNIIDEIDNKEVFHISNQDYTFNQAKCKCESYGARLATYEEMVKAYNNGANWCSYGWSEGQTAYYPTQKCTWDKKTCGKPGINGGFFSNPYLKFGANCYGKKPEGEVAKIKHPKCSFNQFCKLSKNYAASHKLPTDVISPFNKDRWNE